MHATALRQRVIEGRLVLRRAVIPHHEIVPAPVVAVLELRLYAMRRELCDQVAALVFRQTENPHGIAFAHVEAFALRDRMHSDDRMHRFILAGGRTQGLHVLLRLVALAHGFFVAVAAALYGL